MRKMSFTEMLQVTGGSTLIWDPSTGTYTQGTCTGSGGGGGGGGTYTDYYNP